ncbi:response regulator [Sphingomonas sp. H39-1-10]|uniref:response regulator n=1 Tax=Sphingomonas TaxID=13687 RepID=UPI00087EA51E|nr:MULTISPECIES: response regulator [Sphingomonas]MDF0489954.1 response regulator [Sphingomonas pollutisoli]SDA36926.1 Response regulator receiver domain-containing protein [Sphingomonas sp. NFR15]
MRRTIADLTVSRFPAFEEHRLQRSHLIAVVDDDAGMCDAIAELLEVLEFDSDQFSSAEAFLSALAERSFDCLISDIRMPGMDGLELGWRTAILVPEMPVIFVSSMDNEQVRRKASRLGAVAFLRKPIDVDQLQLQVERALRRTHPSTGC